MLKTSEVVAVFVTVITLTTAFFALGWSQGVKETTNNVVKECAEIGVYTDRKLVVQCVPLVYSKSQV